jgi:TnsA endonuclease N terminal
VGRKPYSFDEGKNRRYRKKGRGTGSGEGYLPWLKVNDQPSRGRSHRLPSDKVGRVLHLLSDGEWKAFLKLEADPDVVGVLEQAPLNPHETYQAAFDLKIPHPTTTSGTPYVMTLDFRVTRMIRDRQCDTGISFKYYPETLTPRQHDLHRIMAETLRRQDKAFQIIDQTSFNEDFIKNYDSVRSCYDLSPRVGFPADLVHRLTDAIARRIAEGRDETILRACYDLAPIYATSPTAVFAVLKHLLARRLLTTDYGKPADLAEFPLTDIRFARGNT